MVNNRRFRNEMYNVRPTPMMDCIPQEMVIENVRLSAAYVPIQFLCELFNPIEALKKGTAFPELYSPYNPKDKKSRACHAPDYL